MNNINYIDLAYKLGNIHDEHKNIKLCSTNNNIEIYCINRPNLSVFTTFIKNKPLVLFINPETDISDLVDFCDTLYNKLDIKEMSFKKESIENLTIDKCEGIYYTLLTKNNNYIVLDEEFFDFIPKDGDIVSGDLILQEKITEQKKDEIRSKFDSLLK